MGSALDPEAILSGGRARFMLAAVVPFSQSTLPGGAPILAGVTPAAVIAAFFLLSWLQARWPLRTPAREGAAHLARNLATGGLALAAILPLQVLALAPFAAAVEERRIGLTHLLGLPAWLRMLLAIVLLDWSLWVWHRWNHIVPFLWRFHLVHHVDREMDVSTGLRFHFGEMTLSVLYRAAQIAAIGAPALAVSSWSAVLFVSILFHHSNLRLPLAAERWLVRFVVTPRMHGIHHSSVRAERNTNYASLLSIWDRLHGTCLLSVPQHEIRIGVPPFLDTHPTTLARITLLPFGRGARAGLVAEAAPQPSRVPLSKLAP